MFNGILTLTPFSADLKALPSRLLVVPWGTHDTAQGKVICNSATMELLPRVQVELKRDRVALDFQHNTVEGSKFYLGEPAKVAAFGNIECVPDEGVFLTNLEWTPEGKDIAPCGHYPDLSPTVIRDDNSPS
jgi:phage I-like protein